MKLRDFVVVKLLELPKFVVPGDEFAMPVSVFNVCKRDIYVSIGIKSEGMTVDKSLFFMRACSRREWKNSVKVTVKGGASRASLKVTASFANDSFTQEIELPVRSAYPSVTVGGSGVFEPGTTKLELPLNDFAGSVSGTLALGPTPAVDLNRAVSFLRSYPYACLEQTISTAWPFLILPDAVAELDPLTINDTALRERIEGAINRIQSMQLYDGSFASYPGTNTPYNWGSVYAAHFLLSAKNAGVQFPEEMLAGVLNWLRQFLASMPVYDYNDAERDDLTAKAYAVYVLALNGERPLGWIEYLRENQSSLRPSGHVYLAGARAMIDGNAEALRSVETGTNPGYSGHTLESETRNTAALLSMWLDVEPRAPEATELAQRLLKLGSNGEWFSTQDNSAALTALARYNVEAVDAKSDIRARVTTETSDRALLTYTNNGTESVNVSKLPKGTSILIEAEGTGQGCYSWNITGFPKEQPKPERRNVNVECIYFDEQGNALDLSQPILHGSIIQAVLTVKPSMTVNNLALNYLLPAGLELENPRLEDGAENPAGSYGIVNDVRDDRLVLFFDRLSGERSYGFKMRAVTRGKFRVPQISAFGMYDAGVRFTGSVQPNLEIR